MLAVAASAPHELASFPGAGEPPAGWWSARLESAVPSWLVSVDIENAGPVEIATAIVPFVGDVPEAEIELASLPSATSVTLILDGVRHTLELGSVSFSSSVRAAVGVAGTS